MWDLLLLSSRKAKIPPTDDIVYTKCTIPALIKLLSYYFNKCVMSASSTRSPEIKKNMPRVCAVYNCVNRSNCKKDRKFFGFPGIGERRSRE